MSAIQLIVGLANPGREYVHTRHNAGAWFIETILQNTHSALRPEAKYQGLHALIQLHGKPCHLLIPTTFMNLSGQAVRACMAYHKILPEQVLIAHDEIDLPVGEIKLKFGGGDGGHNGLKDVIRHLNTKNFYRLRIGVGHPGNRDAVVDYVLANPSKVDKQKIDQALVDAEAILPFIMEGEFSKAMQALHTKPE